MPEIRRPGMDNPFYDWSPIATRPALHWPNGAKVALAVVVSLDYYEPQPPAEARGLHGLSGNRAPLTHPDIRNFSQRAYGLRVGLFRIMKLLDRYGLKATAALDAHVAEQYPFVVEECRKRGWEFVGHGKSVHQGITSKMSEAEERDHIRASLDAVERATDKRPSGWLGQGYSESTHTPDLLAEAGVRYVCDWPNDEQPYRMKTATGELISLPLQLEMDDFQTIWVKTYTAIDYARLVAEGFDTLYREGEHSGRMLVLHLHPWLIGQPFMSKYLDKALSHVTTPQAVWKTTTGGIVDWHAQSTK